MMYCTAEQNSSFTAMSCEAGFVRAFAILLAILGTVLVAVSFFVVLRLSVLVRIIAVAVLLPLVILMADSTSPETENA